ncbi:unnamed protein product [Ectocarpus sp. 4 AP-2014]
MKRRQPNRPTAVIIGAMSFLGRCRALSVTPGPTTSAAAAAVVRPVLTSSTGRRCGMLGFCPAAQHHRNSRCGSTSFPPVSLLHSSASSSSFARTSGALGVAAVAASPSRRRRRTALGMVSDRPFRGPEAEEIEEMDFTGLGLLGDLVDAMEEFGFNSPSKIQRKAIPQILNGGNVVFAASTGSGKTLAYLMPLIQQLKVEEAQAEEGGESIRQTKRPRAIVLVPTRELAVQVLEVAKRLSRSCKFSSCGVVGGEDYGKQRQRLAGTVDIVVGTPGRLLKHHEAGNFFMSKANYVVVDEVDTMLTQGFAADIEKLNRPLLANPNRRDTAQLIFVTATLTKAVRKLLGEDGDYPKVRQVETRDVHHTLPSLKHVMIDIKGRDKMSALIDIAQQHYKDFKRTLVFCNTVKSCRAAEFGLREVDLKALSYHGEVPSDERSSNLERFKAGEAKYLVCTDIASRGLDMPDVDHVVMFDFPLNPIDYLHRSGRTARMGAKGRVTSLLAKRDLVLAAAIEQAVQSGLPLDELSSRRTDYATGGKLGPLFGRKGKVSVRGSHHSLKVSTCKPTLFPPASGCYLPCSLCLRLCYVFLVSPYLSSPALSLRSPPLPRSPPLLSGYPIFFEYLPA